MISPFLIGGGMDPYTAGGEMAYSPYNGNLTNPIMDRINRYKQLKEQLLPTQQTATQTASTATPKPTGPFTSQFHKLFEPTSARHTNTFLYF